MVPDGSTAGGDGASGNGRDRDGAPSASQSRSSTSPDGQQPADRQRTRCCRGLTYFSQAMLDNGKLPVRLAGAAPKCAAGLCGIPAC